MEASQTIAVVDITQDLLDTSLPAHLPERSAPDLMPEEPVSLADLGVATGGLVALAAAVALGCGEVSAALHVLPSFAGPGIGALLLTTPGLVVAHQMLGAGGSLGQVVVGVARGFCRAGALSWGLVPIAAYFSATAPGWWFALLGVLGLSVGIVALASAAVIVIGVVSGGLAERLRWRSFVFGWIVLTAVIGARLAAFGW